MKEFLKIILGNQGVIAFASLLFFALMGAALSLLIQTTGRDIKSSATPFHFSWSFFWSDNVKRIISGLILIYCFLRFFPELTGLTITGFYALIVGFSFDKLAQVVKDKTNFLGQKKD